MSGDITSGSISRPGQENLTGDVVALNQVMFTGAVEHAFEAANKLLGLPRVKELVPGRVGEEFQLIVSVGTTTHQVGEDILDAGFLEQAASGRRTIYADRPELSVVFMDSLEQVLTDWDAASEYATAIGTALGKKADQNLFRVLARYARGYVSTVYSGEPTNLAIDTTDYYAASPVATTLNQGVLFAGDASAPAVTWTADLWLDAVLRAKRSFDDRNFPMEGRVLLITNEVNEVIFQSISAIDLIDTDYMNGANANTMEGEVGRLYGFTVIKSNNWPDDDYVLDTNFIGTVGNPYAANFEKTISTVDTANDDGSNTLSFALMMPAVGTVRTKEIGVEMQHSWQNQGDAIFGKYIMGHAALRPNMVIEILGRKWTDVMLPDRQP